MPQSPQSSEALAKRFGGTAVPDAAQFGGKQVETTQTAPSQLPNVLFGVPGGAVPGTPQNGLAMLLELFKGAGKQAGETAVNLGGLVQKIPGVSSLTDTLYGTPGVSQASFAPNSPIREDLKRTNPVQQAGATIEQTAEFMVPSAAAERFAATLAGQLPAAVPRLLPSMAAQGASNSAVAALQGSDPTVAGITGVVTPPAVRGAVTGVKAIGNLAEPLVRAAIKPTVTALRQIAGASREGLDAKASQLVKFIIENRVTSPDKALNIFKESEQELQRLLTAKNPPTDAPQRAMRYLEALERNAAKQGLPTEDVAILRTKMGELLENSMGKDVVTMVPQPHPTLINPTTNQPFTVLVPQTSRVLRTDVTATEALDSARASSRWQTRKQWGEQKGTSIEATKAVERGQRDAIKAAVPEARPILQREGQAIQVGKVLDRMQLRQANREAVSMPAQFVGAVEMTQGKLPVLAFASNWLRNNGLKAGIYADMLRKAVSSGNAKEAAWLLERLGVSVPPAAAGAR